MQLQELQKKIGKEIKKLRCMNDWTQEEVAEKLDICRNAYGDMERGETDINLSRLMQVSELFGIELSYFFDASERNVINLTGIQNAHSKKRQYNHCHVHTTEENNLQHELEKAQLLLQEREKEIEYLKKENKLQQEMLALIARQTSSQN
jgi:transcriptional regulator with XRE-family HTH domain